jgi:hypothetical protein
MFVVIFDYLLLKLKCDGNVVIKTVCMLIFKFILI